MLLAMPMCHRTLLCGRPVEPRRAEQQSTRFNFLESEPRINILTMRPAPLYTAKYEDQVQKLDIKSILARQGLLYRNIPRCPACGAEQVQIMRHEPPAEWQCRECRHWFAFEPAPFAKPWSLGVRRAAVASNIECPRCGVISSDFVRGVCRTCYMRDYVHDSYGRRLCIKCREPGTYAHGLCAKCYMRDYRRRRRMFCTCASCGVSFQSSRRDTPYCSLSCRLRARHAAQSAKEGH
jgi:ribosomal protein L37AE/L43A